MNKIRQSYVFAGLAVLFWSTIPTAFKVSLQQIDILPLLTIASITSSAVLFIVVVSGHKAGLIAGATLKELLTSAVLGFINPFIYYLILLKAYRLLPAQGAQPLNMIWPLVLAFLSVPLLGQKIPAKSYAALCRRLYYCLPGSSIRYGPDQSSRSAPCHRQLGILVILFHN